MGSLSPKPKKGGNGWIAWVVALFVLGGGAWFFRTELAALLAARPSGNPPVPPIENTGPQSPSMPSPIVEVSPVPSLPAVPVPAPASEPAKPDPLTWMLEKKERWPSEVTLLQPAEFPAVLQGKVVGSLRAPAGTEVQVVELNRENVGVVYNGGGARIRIEATDLLELAALEMNSHSDGAAVALAKEPTQSAKPPLPPLQKTSTKPFVHPGLLHSEADFERMRTKVKAKESPWIDGWGKLTSSRFAQLSIKPRPAEIVIRGDVPGNNVALLFMDAAAAYQLALRWKISGEQEYAEKALEILNAWGTTLKQVTGNSDRFLAAGIYGYQFANAAEIMRTCKSWKPSDLKRFQDMMVDVFCSMNETFLFGRNGGKDHNGAAITNYWANWDLCNIASMQAIGVLCDRRDIYDRAVTYFKTGSGNGALHKAIYYIHEGNLGQWQEAGRDQGHTTLGISLMGPIMEAAWNQGEDLYGLENNRFLAGAEYVAKFSLGAGTVPFQKYKWGTGQNGASREQDQIAGTPGTFRNGYEMVVNHYVNRMGIAAPYSEAVAARSRPEGGPGGHASSFDQVGLGTLTAFRDPEVKNPTPSGLEVRRRAGKVFLSWWGAVGADTYNVKRATSPNGPFATIATGIKDVLIYTDETAGPGRNFYVVTGMRGGKETGPSKLVSISAVPALCVHLKFDETTGGIAANAADKAASCPLPNSGSWTSGRIGNCASLDGKSQYVELPVGVVSDLSDFTISAWVNLRNASRSSRLFDFGGNRGEWMTLVVNSGNGKPRFDVTTVHGYNTQSIEGSSAIPTNRWVHVAITLSGKTGTVYMDGESIGSNPAIDLAPFQLGATLRNWIGRSQHERDPYLDGKVDDFRIYDGALTPEQIANLAKSTSAL